MSRSCPRLVLAALRGGSGKTTVSVGLVTAWRNQGRQVIPFKKGPDYIDAGWLAQAADQPCYNLDPYLMSRERIMRSFAFRTAGEYCGALIEGNRGLFDGLDEAGTYSTAELAKLLAAPTILIVHCNKATRTLAAVVSGCDRFDPDLRLAGVILNEVATSRQEKLVRSTIESYTGVPVLGAIPRVKDHDLPERHLGLVPHQEHPMARRALNLLGDLAAKHLDLDRLWETAASAPPFPEPAPEDFWDGIIEPGHGPLRIGVIRDSVFQFYYPENLEALERLGAETVIFSALEASSLPEVDALYLGGGFPETQAEILANHEGLRTSIREAAARGLPMYAECGGLMYLGEALELDGRTYPMAGVFPVTFGLEKSPQGHGYTRVAVEAENPYYSIGERLVGHEFHYSRPLFYDEKRLKLVFKVERGHGFDQGRDGLVSNNVLATYTHLHALGSTRWAEALTTLAARYRKAANSG